MFGRGVQMVVEVGTMTGGTSVGVTETGIQHTMTLCRGADLEAVITGGRVLMTIIAIGLMDINNHIKAIMAGRASCCQVIGHIASQQMVNMHSWGQFILVAVKAVGDGLTDSVGHNHHVNSSTGDRIRVDITGGKMTGAASPFRSSAVGQLVMLDVDLGPGIDLMTTVTSLAWRGLGEIGERFDGSDMAVTMQVQVKIIKVTGLTVVKTTVLWDPVIGGNASQGAVTVMAGEALVMDLVIQRIDKFTGWVRVALAAFSMQLNGTGYRMLGTGVQMAIEISAMAGGTGVGIAEASIKFTMTLGRGADQHGVVTGCRIGMTVRAVGLMGLNDQVEAVMATSGRTSGCRIIGDIACQEMINMHGWL